MSSLFNYIKNQYLLGNFSPEDLEKLVSLKRISDEERLQILALK